MKRLPFAKIAKILLAVYAFTLTLLVILAMTIGPFKESSHFWSKLGVLESLLRETDRDQKKLTAEKDRLLKTLKNLQADWASSQETIRALRKLVNNPQSEQELVNANQLAEKLSQERAVLIIKLNEMRQAIQSCESRNSASGAPGAASSASDKNKPTP